LPLGLLQTKESFFQNGFFSETRHLMFPLSHNVNATRVARVDVLLRTTRHFLIFFTGLALLLLAAGAQADWGPVGSAGFSAGPANYTSLAFGPDGAPYVAYEDYGNGQKATVMRYDSVSGAWEPVGSAGFSAGTVYTTSLAFGPDGAPTVAYEDDDNGDKATVMRFNSVSGAWEPVGSVGFSAGTALYTSLAFGPDGAPTVAYMDSGNGNKATVMRYNSVSGAWENVGSAGFSAGMAYYTSLAFGPDGAPYVAYQDVGNGNKATVMRYNSVSGAWEPVGSVGFSADIVNYTSLAFGPDGAPTVAYEDWGNSQKTTVMRFNSVSGAWELVGSAGFSAGVAQRISLAFGPDGAPTVAYEDNGNGGKATVMRYNSVSGAWAPVGSAGFSAGTAVATSLAFGPDGVPTVAYSDGGNGSGATVMRFTAPPPPASAASVPALNEWALALLAILLVGGAMILIRVQKYKFSWSSAPLAPCGRGVYRLDT